MKTLITIILVFTTFSTSTAQNQSIETQSIALEDLISFIAETYPLANENDDIRNITFLIQTKRRNLSNETAIMLKQAFKFLSKRLSEEDKISIVAYSGLNGLVLDKTSPKELKKILYVINDFKGNVNKIKSDGIAYAYEYTNKNYDEEALNSVVMIRNPNDNEPVMTSNMALQETDETTTPKPKNNLLLLTAITLLPELISIIKD